MGRKRVYRCILCGWESSDFSEGRGVGDNRPALAEVESHFEAEHPDFVGETDKPPLRVIFDGDHVEVKIG